MKYFQVFVDEASRDKRVGGLKTRDAAVDAIANYIEEMAREGVAIKCISSDGAGELRRFRKISTYAGGSRNQVAKLTTPYPTEQRNP